MTIDRTRAESALAAVVHAIRDEWDAHGVQVTLRRCADKPFAELAAAAIYAAVKRTEQRTPACIALDGEHWRALERMTTTAATTQTPTTQPPNRLACPIHDKPTPCPECPPPAAPEVARRHLADARAALRATRHQPYTAPAEGTPA